MLPKYSKMEIAASRSNWRAWRSACPFPVTRGREFVSVRADDFGDPRRWRRARGRAAASNAGVRHGLAYRLVHLLGPAPWTTGDGSAGGGFSTTNWSSVEGDDQRVRVLVRSGACRVIGTSSKVGDGMADGR